MSDFIISKLTEASITFRVEFLYHYCAKTNTHIIKVLDDNVYVNSDFMEFELGIYDEVADKECEILFVSDINDFNFIKSPFIKIEAE